MTENLRKECVKKELDNMKKLTRIVFNKWYAETLQENTMVIPDELAVDSQPADASPPRSPNNNQLNNLETDPNEMQVYQNESPLSQ